jgi:hypothetical protein
MQGTCPAVTFQLQTYLVKVTSSTVFAKGPCKDLKNDQQVTVHGQLIDAHTVTALTIEFNK